MTDSQISKCRDKTVDVDINDVEEFEEWQPEDDQPEELEPMTHSNGNNNAHWSVAEMFRANKGLCTDSDFATDLSQYQTTTIVATEADRERANKIAQQIENDSVSRHNARLENDDEERNLGSKTRFDDVSTQSATNNVSWRAQPHRNGSNPVSGGNSNNSSGRGIGYRGDRDRDRDRRSKQPPQLRSRPSATNITATVTVNSYVPPRTSPTAVSPRDSSTPLGDAQTPVNAVAVPLQPTTTVIPSTHSVSAPAVTLSKETSPKAEALNASPVQQPPQRTTGNNTPVSTPVPSKFKFNPDAPAFVPSAKKELGVAISPAVWHVQSYPPPRSYVYANMMPAGVPSQVIVSSGPGMIVQNPQQVAFQQQPQIMQPPTPQTYPLPRSYVYANMMPAGVPPQVIASSGPNAGVIMQNPQQAAFQQQPQIMQPPTPQSYPPPNSYIYANMMPAGVPPQVIASSGPNAGMIVQNPQQIAFQQQQPQMIQPQAQMVRKGGHYGYTEEARPL